MYRIMHAAANTLPPLLYPVAHAVLGEAMMCCLVRQMCSGLQGRAVLILVHHP